MFKQILNREVNKRIFDIATASFGLVAFAPLVTTIAVVIYLEDQGPILFTQERIGHNRQPFKIFKFRSMNEQEVTKVGKWLRETGLDEIPQFLNVLCGDMSMVGPRPLTEEDIERLGWNQEDYDARWDSVPGITGLAQLRGKNANSSYRLDMTYQKHSSLLLDSELIFFSLLGNVFGKKRVRRFLSVVK